MRRLAVVVALACIVSSIIARAQTTKLQVAGSLRTVRARLRDLLEISDETGWHEDVERLDAEAFAADVFTYNH